jgi:hypothetical protein
MLNNIISFFGEHHETFPNHKEVHNKTSSEHCCEYMGPNELCIVVVVVVVVSLISISGTEIHNESFKVLSQNPISLSR